MRVCRALVGPADADDAWSETFLSALEAYPRMNHHSNVRGWLVTIAYRKAIDQIRGASRRPVPTADPTSGDADPDWIPAERDEDLWGAVEALPWKQRGAVAAHYLAEMPYSEVAELLGGSEAAARRAAADGIAKLRKTYTQGRVDA